MAWAPDTIEDLYEHGIFTPEEFAEAFCDRQILTSAAFAGVGSDVVGDAMVEHAVAHFLGKHMPKSLKDRGLHFKLSLIHI
eukprot:10021165-Alexandrium_andersonii.AAC.1